MPLGYRDPMTYKDLDTVASMKLTNHVLNIEMLKEKRDNVGMHQYIHELMQGKDPRKSDWWIKRQ